MCERECIYACVYVCVCRYVYVYQYMYLYLISVSYGAHIARYHHSLTIIILGNVKRRPRFSEIRTHIPATLPSTKVALPATPLKPASPIAKLSQLRARAKKGGITTRPVTQRGIVVWSRNRWRQRDTRRE